MENNKGFISLKTVSNYWDKVLYDYNLLEQNPTNVYFAFNFFITSYHLIDWLFQGKTAKESLERKSLEENPILRINYHICNGAKHFEPKNNKNNSIEKIEETGYAESDYCMDDYSENDILIYLEEEFHSEFGESIEIMKLAEKIVCFWQEELVKQNLIS